MAEGKEIFVDTNHWSFDCKQVRVSREENGYIQIGFVNSDGTEWPVAVFGEDGVRELIVALASI